MAIQNRRGSYKDLDPDKLLPGEYAIVLQDDPHCSDGRAAYLCFEAGNVKRIATYEDMVEKINGDLDNKVSIKTYIGNHVDNKNVIDVALHHGTITFSTGIPREDGTNAYSDEFVITEKTNISSVNSNYKFIVFRYDTDGNKVDYIPGNYVTSYELNDTQYKYRLLVIKDGGISYDDVVNVYNSVFIEYGIFDSTTTKVSKLETELNSVKSKIFSYDYAIPNKKITVDGNLNIDIPTGNILFDRKNGFKFLSGSFKASFSNEFQYIGFDSSKKLIQRNVSEELNDGDFVLFVIYQSIIYTPMLNSMIFLRGTKSNEELTTMVSDHDERISTLENTDKPFSDELYPISLPTDMYFVEGRDIPIYKKSFIYSRNFSDLDMFIVKDGGRVNNGNTIPTEPIVDCVYEKTMLNPSKIVDSFDIYVSTNKRGRFVKKTISTHIASDNLSSVNYKHLFIGDSLTFLGDGWNCYPNFTVLKLKEMGATVDFRNEGRGGWSFTNFVGMNTKGTNLPSDQYPSYSHDTNPFLSLATDIEKEKYPDYCFTFTNAESETSYANATDKTQDFYIFNPKHYETISGFAPDLFTIALGTNDISSTEKETSLIERSKNILAFMVSRIREFYTNAIIGVIPQPALANDDRNDIRMYNMAKWIKECVSYVNTLRETDSKVYVVPVWISMNKDFSFPMTLGSDGLYTISDLLHFNSGSVGNIGNLEYANVLSAWVANALLN